MKKSMTTKIIEKRAPNGVSDLKRGISKQFENTVAVSTFVKISIPGHTLDIETNTDRKQCSNSEGSGR